MHNAKQQTSSTYHKSTWEKVCPYLSLLFWIPLVGALAESAADALNIFPGFSRFVFEISTPGGDYYYFGVLWVIYAGVIFWGSILRFFIPKLDYCWQVVTFGPSRDSETWEVTAEPGAPGKTLPRYGAGQSSQGEHSDGNLGRQFEQYVHEKLSVLTQANYEVYSGIRVRGVGESEIDHIVIGRNGIFVIEAKRRFGDLKNGPGQWEFHNRATGQIKYEDSPAGQNLGHIYNLQAFLKKHLGSAVVDSITFHNVICVHDQTGVTGLEHLKPGVIVAKPLALLEHIPYAPGQNPLTREQIARLMMVLLRETASCRLAYLVRQSRREGGDGSLPRMLSNTWYDWLSVSPMATEEQIRRAYREIARRVHPDHGGTDQEMKLLNQALEQLTAGRKQYDAWLRSEAIQILQEADRFVH